MPSPPRVSSRVTPECYALVPATAATGAVLARYGELALVEVGRVPDTLPQQFDRPMDWLVTEAGVGKPRA